MLPSIEVIFTLMVPCASGINNHFSSNPDTYAVIYRIFFRPIFLLHWLCRPSSTRNFIGSILHCYQEVLCGPGLMPINYIPNRTSKLISYWIHSYERHTGHGRLPLARPESRRTLCIYIRYMGLSGAALHERQTIIAGHQNRPEESQFLVLPCADSRQKCISPRISLIYAAMTATEWPGSA